MGDETAVSGTLYFSCLSFRLPITTLTTFCLSQYTLRQKGDKNQLSDDRVLRLEEIGFSWTAPSFRKKKEGGRDFPSPPGANMMPQPQPHLMPPGGHPHQPLPPHDFRRWV